LRTNTIRNTIATTNALNQKKPKHGESTTAEFQVSSQPSRKKNTFSASSPELSSNSRKRNFLKKFVPGVAAASCIGSIGYMYASNPALFSWDSINDAFQPIYDNADHLFKKVVANYYS
jgi:hypothetical protein